MPLYTSLQLKAIALQDRLEKSYPIDLWLETHEDKDGQYIALRWVEVPDGERDMGIGSKIINAICNFADQNKVRIMLTPTENLEGFYKKFGFKSHKRNTTYQDMIRYPQEQTNKEDFYDEYKNEIKQTTESQNSNMLNNKEDIKKWLDLMEIKHYTINDDLTVDVAGKPEYSRSFQATMWNGVNISNKKLTEIPIQFGVVEGHFKCNDNKLTSLKGIPKRCLSLECTDNLLKEIDFVPDYIKNTFNCSGNKKLTTIDLFPKGVTHVIVDHCSLESISNVPTTVEYFNCSHNNLSTLNGINDNCKTIIASYNERLESLENMPQGCENLTISGNYINTRNGAPKECRISGGMYITESKRLSKFRC